MKGKGKLINASRTEAEMNPTCYFHGVPVYADTKQPKNLITFIQRGNKMKGKEKAKFATVIEEEWRVPSDPGRKNLEKKIAELGITYNKMTDAEKALGIEQPGFSVKPKTKLNKNNEARLAAAGHQRDLLAEEHWEWIKKLLDTQLLVTERLFKDGFKHGWKHAKEYYHDL